MSYLRENSQEDDLHPSDIRRSCRGKRSRRQKKTRERVSSGSISPTKIYSRCLGLTSAERTSQIFVHTTITCRKWRILVSTDPLRFISQPANTHIAAFNLINDIDISETQARVAAFRKENAALIEANQQREEAYAQALKEHEEAERREKQLRAEELRRAEEEEREARESERRALIDNLEHSNADATRLVAQARAEALKRAAARSAAAQQAVKQSSANLLRSRAAQSAVVPDQPHVPLQDNYYAYEDLYSLRSLYFDPASDAVRRDKEGIMRAGGYRLEEAWARAIRSAVAGLDILTHSPRGASTDALDADTVMASTS